MFHSSETDKQYTTTDSKEDLVCTVCDGACIRQMLVMSSLLTQMLILILCLSTFVFTCNFIRNKSSFLCFRWYYLFSGVKGCLELLITQLKLQRYDVVLHFLTSNIKSIIICLLQNLWLVLHWSFPTLNPKLTINGNASFQNKAFEAELCHLFISHIYFKWMRSLITVV